MIKLLSSMISLALFFIHGCGRDHKAIVATGPGPTRVLAEAKASGFKDDIVIATLNAGDTLRALDYETLKDYRIYEIMLPDGRTGWVTLGDNCKLIDTP